LHCSINTLNSLLLSFHGRLIDGSARTVVGLQLSTLFYPLLLLVLWRSKTLLALAQSATIPLYIVSRLPQLRANYINKSTGALPWITFAANGVGSMVRLCDPAVRADMLLSVGFVISVILNAALVGQIFAYRRNTQRQLRAPSPTENDDDNDDDERWNY